MRIGILGAGAIATTMATTLQSLKEAECYAVAARDKRRAQAFADKFGFLFAYGSYADMLSDPYVELVYIATPHSLHYEHIKMCLNHGKHVLCEKAFTANAKQAEEVIQMATERGLLLTEAIWTRYMPMRNIIDDVVKSGIIGHPTSLSANLGYPLEHIERLVKPELCGGALLDLGVYVLNFASMVFGNNIEGISATCVKYQSGVDAQETIMLSYEDGKMASLYVTMLAQTDRRGLINGTNGYIEIDNINNYEAIHVYNLDRKVIAEYAAPCQVTGYEYEVLSAIQAINEGRLECPEMPHSETILMMQLMDNIREAWNIRFPFDVEATTAEKELAEAAALEDKMRKEREKASDGDTSKKDSLSDDNSGSKSEASTLKEDQTSSSSKLIAHQNFKTSVISSGPMAIELSPSTNSEIEITEIKMSKEQEMMQKRAASSKKATAAKPGTAVSAAIHKAAENAEKPNGEAIPELKSYEAAPPDDRFVFGQNDIPPMPENLREKLKNSNNPNGSIDDTYEKEIKEELDDSKYKFASKKDEPYFDKLDPKKTVINVKVNENYKRQSIIDNNEGKENDETDSSSSDKKNSLKKRSPFRKLGALFNTDNDDDSVYFDEEDFIDDDYIDEDDF